MLRAHQSDAFIRFYVLCCLVLMAFIHIGADTRH